MTSTAARSAALALIDDFRNACAKRQAALAALPAGAFVLVWHDSPLKVKGSQIGMLGDSIFHASEAEANRRADAWAEVLKEKELDDEPAARVMSRDEALAHMRATDETLIAAMNAGHIPGIN